MKNKSSFIPDPQFFPDIAAIQKFQSATNIFFPNVSMHIYVCVYIYMSLCKYNLDVLHKNGSVLYFLSAHYFFLLFSIPCRSHCINTYRSTSFFVKVV